MLAYHSCTSVLEAAAGTKINHERDALGECFLVVHEPLLQEFLQNSTGSTGDG